MPPKIGTRRSAGGAIAAAAGSALTIARRYRTRSSARGLPPQTTTAEMEAETETAKAEPEEGQEEEEDELLAYVQEPLESASSSSAAAAAAASAVACSDDSATDLPAEWTASAIYKTEEEERGEDDSAAAEATAVVAAVPANADESSAMSSAHTDKRRSSGAGHAFTGIGTKRAAAAPARVARSVKKRRKGQGGTTFEITCKADPDADEQHEEPPALEADHANAARQPLLPESKCRRCGEEFDQADRLPRTLLCTHSACSACLLGMQITTPGSYVCPTCNCWYAIQLPAGMAAAAMSSPAAWLQLLPVTLPVTKSPQPQPKQLPLLPGPDLPVQCACDPACTAPATRWCNQCDNEMCAAHDASVHVHSLSFHRRVSLAQRAAERHARLTHSLTTAGSKLKTSARATVRQFEREVRLRSARFHEQARMLVQLRAMLTADQTHLRQLRVAADRMTSLENSQAQQQGAAWDALLRRGARVNRKPTGCSGLLASLTNKQFGHLKRFMGDVPMDRMPLLYRATRDGFKAEHFRAKCEEKGATLTLVKVAGSGNICGAFTPVSWPSVVHGTDIGDRTGRTFLFSLSNLHGRAVKLRLKDSERAYALRVRCGEVGPGFGAGADLRLMFDKAANLMFDKAVSNSTSPTPTL